MGINCLFPHIKKYGNKVHISEFYGRIVAVDASCWIHKALAISLSQHGNLERWVIIGTILDYFIGNAWVNSWSNHPLWDTPGNLPDRQFTGLGNLPFIYVHGGRVLEDHGDLTNGCPESHSQILRQHQNLVSGTHVGALIVFCALVVKVGWNLL
jgi:hypothetical protein